MQSPYLASFWNSREEYWGHLRCDQREAANEKLPTRSCQREAAPASIIRLIDWPRPPTSGVTVFITTRVRTKRRSSRPMDQKRIPSFFLHPGHLHAGLLHVGLALVMMLAVLPAHAGATGVRLMAFGDSLVHGYGLEEQETFPAQLEAALQERGHDVRVLNAGNSGGTTAAGLARLDWAMDGDQDDIQTVQGCMTAMRGTY